MAKKQKSYSKNGGMKSKLTNPIAKREYQLITSSGEHRSVLLQFDQPRELPDEEGFKCIYQIDGLGRAQTGFAGGADSLQALELAMQTVLMRLVATDEYRDGRLTWNGSSNLGLPVHETIRPLIRKTPP